MTITSCCLATSLATRRCWHPRLLLQHCCYHTLRSTCSKLRKRTDSRYTPIARSALQKPAAVLDMSRNVNNGSAYLQASYGIAASCHIFTQVTPVIAGFRSWVADWTLQNLHHLSYCSLIIKGSCLFLCLPMHAVLAFYCLDAVFCLFPGTFSMLGKDFSVTVSSISSN